MKNILITSIGFSSVVKGGGGISAYTNDLVNNLASAGYQISVFVIREQLNDNISNIENKNYSLNLFKVPEKKNDEIKLVDNIFNEIIKLNPDIIIDNGTSYLPGLWSNLPEQIVKISIVHAFSPRYVFNNSGIIGKMSTYNHEYVDWFVCQNSRMITDISKRYKIPKSKLIFIPQTANHSLEPFRQNEDKKLKILFGAGNRKNKGSDVMLEICKELKATDWSFEVCWCSNAEDYKTILIEDKRFVFTGHLSREVFMKKLAESDVIIIPTLQDTGPMLLVEAMSLGVVPICNNLAESAIPDIVTHSENGFLVDKNNSLDYKEIIYSLINNKELLKKIANNGYNYFENYLKADKQVEVFKKLFVKNDEVRKNGMSVGKKIAYWHLRNTKNHSKHSLFRLKRKIIEFFELIDVKEIK